MNRETTWPNPCPFCRATVWDGGGGADIATRQAMAPGYEAVFMPDVTVCQDPGCPAHYAQKEQKRCYQCGRPVDYLFDDSRCDKCTRLTPEEVRGDSPWEG